MANLPEDRLGEVPPFYYTGMDVWGPVLVTEKRSTRTTSGQKKLWVLLFSCMVSRAIHVEIIPSLDTTAFRNAFQRFMSIRGKPKLLRRDDAGNFVAGQAQMADVDMKALEGHLYNQSIEWIFNPPYASNFGGVYERHILSIQNVLEGTMALCCKRRLNYDEFHTLLLEACAIVNNTPLTEVSDDVNDPEPITPATLLLLRKNPNPPTQEEFSEKDMCQYGKLRYKRVQFLAESFWQRWRCEYVTTLHKRHKWKTREACVGEGDVVLIKSKSAKRNEWLLGRVVDRKISEDGLVRSVSLRLPPLPGSNKPRTTKRCIHDLVLVVPSAKHSMGCIKSCQ